VDDLSIEVRPGEVLGLVGPNGAGKTTTVRMLCGLLEPSSGEVRIAGRSVSGDPLEARRSLGYVPDGAPLYPNLSPRQHLLLVGRLVWLQVVRYDYYTDLSQGNRVRIEPLPAPRGIIYDRQGLILAENQPAYQLELVPEQVPDLDATLQGLVRIGLLNADDVDDAKRTVRSRRPFDSVPIRLHLSESDMAAFGVNRFEFPGVDIRTRLARSYPQGETAVHALGYVGTVSATDLARIDREAYAGTSTIGKVGIEAAYEDPLRGRNGSREIKIRYP